MRLSEFISKIYEIGGGINSEIKIRDTDGNTLSLEDCDFEIDCCNVITINTGNY
jgi:hypothetical protein